MQIVNSKNGNEIQDERYVSIISKMVKDHVREKMIDGYLVEIVHVVQVDDETVIKIKIM